MQVHEVVIIIASTLTAAGTIFGVLRFWMRRFAKGIFTAAIEDLKDDDVSRASYLGRQRQALDDLQTEIMTRLDDIQRDMAALQKTVRHNNMSIRRNEILMLVNTQPKKIDSIEEVYAEYTKQGGNSYVSDVMDVWRDEYVRPIIRKRLNANVRRKK